MADIGRQHDKVTQLVSELGENAAGECIIGGAAVERLADQYGTPLFVYSGDFLERHVKRVQQALGPDVDLYYSLKANPSLGLCQLIASQGVGAEIASGGELLLAEAAGFPEGRTLFAGPGKTDHELRLAIDRGIGAINVESTGELSRIGALARAHGRTARVGIRINPHQPLSGANMRMGGGTQQFGIPEEDVLELIRAYRRDRSIRIVGVHVYAGTQIFDTQQIVLNAQSILELAASLGAVLDHPLEFVDVGGGFGVPYFDGTDELDLDALGPAFQRIAAQYRADERLNCARIVVELGRYLVAAAGVYVTRVVDTKVSRGRAFLVTDGGMNHQTPATGNFGQVFRKPYPVAVLNRLDSPIDDCASVVGPCCTPLDVLGTDLQLPTARVGDTIGVFYSGAYGYSASSLAFLSHPTPAEVLVYCGKTHLLREAGHMDQVLHGQQRLPIETSPIVAS